MPSDTMSPTPKDHPMKKAWDAFKATEEFRNSRRWALTIAPMIQAGDPDAQRKRLSLMPIEQREQHVDGALWNAFVHGWRANASLSADSDPADCDTEKVREESSR